jgi:hypothetical protein
MIAIVLTRVVDTAGKVFGHLLFGYLLPLHPFRNCASSPYVFSRASLDPDPWPQFGSWQKCERRPWWTPVMCLKRSRIWKYCTTSFVSTLEGFMFCVPHVLCVVFRREAFSTSIPCTNKILDVLMDGTYVFLRSPSLRMLRHSLRVHIWMVLFQDVQSRYACSDRSSLETSCHILPMCIHMDAHPHGPSWRDASYYSWTETSFRILPQCIQIALDQCVACSRETSPPWVPNIFSHPGCVHWYGFNFKCTVSTCFLFCFMPKHRHSSQP